MEQSQRINPKRTEARSQGQLEMGDYFCHQRKVFGCPDDQGGDVGRNNGVSSQQVGGEKRFSLNFLECYDETSNYESIAKKPFFYHLLSFCSTSFHTYGFKDAV